MADIPVKAFLSCSFLDTDRQLIDLFSRLLTAVQIIPETHRFPNVGSVTPEIEEHIKASDCLVAIATRRDQLKEGEEWTFSDWVRDEIAIAKAFGKPVALFIEDGVRIGGAIRPDLRYVSFSRTNLLETIDRIVAFLFNLRSHVDQVMNHRSQLSSLKLLRELIHVRESFTREEFSYSCEIVMRSLIDDLPAAHHSHVLFDDTAGLSVKPWDFAFASIESPPGVTVTSQKVHSSERSYVWLITFDPPLKQQERVRYGFRFVYTNDQPYTLEDVKKRIEAGTYPTTEPRSRVLDWTINYPTRELNYDIEFPQGYAIGDPRLDVRIGTVGHVAAEEEVKRLLAEKALSIDRVFDTWRASLRVRNPIFGHNYSISYVPPRADQLPSPR